MSEENDRSSDSKSGESAATGKRRRNVERTLASMLKSEQFASSQQLAEFLKFIVNKTLDGQQQDLKAYTIAVDALGRGEDFDPQTNAAVRVAAGRLRQALTLYQADPASSADPVRIELATGSYVPAFIDNISSEESVEPDALENSGDLISSNDPTMEQSVLELVERLEGSNSPVNTPGSTGKKHQRWLMGLLALLLVGGISLAAFPNLSASFKGLWQAKTPAPAAVNIANIERIRPRIMLSVILPDNSYPDWLNQGNFSDSIVLAIARFDDFEFVGVHTGTTPTLSDNNEADYHLLVSAYNRKSVVRIFGRLIREKDGAVIWSTERAFGEPETVEDRNVPVIAGETFAPVGSPYGVIYADLLANSDPREPLKCIISGYEYFSNKTEEGHANARSCGEQLVAANAQVPSLLAMLSFIYLDEYRENRNPRERNALAAAEKTALDAIALGPTSARAHQALFAVRKVQGDFRGARAMAETALRLNPYDTDIINDYAAWLISVGDFGKGEELLKRAEQLLGAHPAWVEVYRFLSYELNNDTRRADIVARTFDYKRSPMTAMAVAISASRSGNLERARRALQEIKNIDPDMLTDIKSNMLKRGFAPGVADIISARLERARSRTGF